MHVKREGVADRGNVRDNRGTQFNGVTLKLDGDRN